MRAHADLIKAWAEGAVIQVYDDEDGWVDDPSPSFSPQRKYRIKPEPVIHFVNVLRTGCISRAQPTRSKARLAVHPDMCAGMLRITLDADKKTLLGAEIVR